MSLSINIASVSANGIYLSPSSSVSLYVCVCVGRLVCQSIWKVYCGKTAYWIRMPFRMVSGMGVLVGMMIVEGKWTVLGVNLGHPIVTNEVYVA